MSTVTLGFATLGYIIKKVSGKTYETYINDNILKPLGMSIPIGNTPKCRKDNLRLVIAGSMING
jgi:CubicO group peptidase (beta-lactamase class C family)